MTGTEGYRKFFSKLYIYKYIKDNKNFLIDNNEFIDFTNTIIKIDDYIENIKKWFFL